MKKGPKIEETPALEHVNTGDLRKNLQEFRYRIKITHLIQKYKSLVEVVFSPEFIAARAEFIETAGQKEADAIVDEIIEAHKNPT